uniref:DOMON domain-containing protein n=1 Tax=Romanomermis culicivorax TaxID=13658 RepID=A0A915JZ56_ROMCU
KHLSAGIPCNSSYRYPEFCSLQDCDYQIRWSVIKNTGDVYFNIIDRVDSDNYWTGIGFNTKGVMENAEVIMAGFMPNSTFLYRTIIFGQNYSMIQLSRKSARRREE